MTKEAEWLAATEPVFLDIYRAAKKQHRKWRLYGVGCARRAVALSPDPRLDAVTAVVEDFADGVADWKAVLAARKILAAVRKELGDEFGPNEAKIDAVDALERTTRKAPVETLGASEPASYAFAALARPNFDAGIKAERPRQVQVARCVFGNPFRPVEFAPAWRTTAVLGLAESMYTSRDFGGLPILADALQDAGCEVEDLLAHCRGPGPHAKGCWAIDLVLGKPA